MAFRIRQGLDAARGTVTPAQGEPLWTTDTKKLYIGDGSTPGGIAVSSEVDLTQEGLQDIVGAMFSGNSTSGITFSYNDTTGKINATVNFPPSSGGENYHFNITGADSTLTQINRSETIQFIGSNGIGVSVGETPGGVTVVNIDGSAVEGGGGGISSSEVLSQVGWYLTAGDSTQRLINNSETVQIVGANGLGVTVDDTGQACIVSLTAPDVGSVQSSDTIFSIPFYNSYNRPHIVTLTVTAAGTGSCVVTLNGSAFPITVSSGINTNDVATSIASNGYSGYTVQAVSNTVIFTSIGSGPQTGTFSFTNVGTIVATFTTTQAGLLANDLVSAGPDVRYSAEEGCLSANILGANTFISQLINTPLNITNIQANTPIAGQATVTFTTHPHPPYYTGRYVKLEGVNNSAWNGAYEVVSSTPTKVIIITTQSAAYVSGGTVRETTNRGIAIFPTGEENYVTLGGTIDLNNTLGPTDYGARFRVTSTGGFGDLDIGVANFSLAEFIQVHNDTFANSINLIRGRGTISSTTSVQNGDMLGAVTFSGLDGVNSPLTNYFPVAPSASIYVTAAQTPKSIAGQPGIAGKMYFQTAKPDAGYVLTDALIIDEYQTVSILNKTEINGQIRISGNQIETIVSNASLDFKTNGSGAINLDANTSVTGTLGVTVAYGLNFNFNADGGVQIPVLSAAPTSPITGSIYVANGVSWDPASKSGSVPYPVYYDGSAYNGLY